MKWYQYLLLIFFLLMVLFSPYIFDYINKKYNNHSIHAKNEDIYPNFSDVDYERDIFESYSELDYLNRAGVAFAKLGVETMPTEKRKSLSSVTPSGWVSIKYDHIDGKYLYNRCHLIGFQLSGENANIKNLITCTRKMNAVSMLEYENKVAEYIKKTKNHVLYRVTPIYENENLLASGVIIEASSVEDRCGNICFNIYIPNEQDGVIINYKDGSSVLAN